MMSRWLAQTRWRKTIKYYKVTTLLLLFKMFTAENMQHVHHLMFENMCHGSKNKLNIHPKGIAIVEKNFPCSPFFQNFSIFCLFSFFRRILPQGGKIWKEVSRKKDRPLNLQLTRLAKIFECTLDGEFFDSLFDIDCIFVWHCSQIYSNSIHWISRHWHSNNNYY